MNDITIAAAHPIAHEMQAEKIAKAEAATATPWAEYEVAALEVVREMQGDAQEAALKKAADFADSFAHLIAADQVLAATIGDRFSMPSGGVAPFNGLTVVRNFIRALPDRLTPPELAEARLLPAAHEISSAILSQIKES